MSATSEFRYHCHCNFRYHCHCVVGHENYDSFRNCFEHKHELQTSKRGAHPALKALLKPYIGKPSYTFRKACDELRDQDTQGPNGEELNFNGAEVDQLLKCGLLSCLTILLSVLLCFGRCCMCGHFQLGVSF